MDMKKVFDYIDTLRPQMVESLGELISFPSYRQEPAEGAPFGVPARQCLDKALEICENLGFTTKNYDGYAGTASITDGEPSLGILAHLDVVPEGDGWTYDPYKATVEDGILYGRGAMDDKGPAVAVMYAMKALKDLGVPLPNGVELIVGTDEECGSSDIRYFRQHAKMPKWLFTPDANYPIINIEKGHIGGRFTAHVSGGDIIELHGGKTANAVPASAYAVVKNISENEIFDAIKRADCTVDFTLSSVPNGIRIDAKGVNAHASTPDLGDNALTALIKVLSLLPDCGEAQEKLRGLYKAFPYRETNGASAGLEMRDDISGALTLAFDILNLENGEFSGVIDIRFPICGTVDGISGTLTKALNDAGFEAAVGGVEPHYVDSDGEFVRTLLGAYESVTGKKGECLAIGGGTYVHGIPGGVAFGCEVDGEDNRIHGADEFIRVDALVENAKIFAEAIVRVCNNKELK